MVNNVTQKPVWRMNTGVKPSDRLENSPVLEVSGRLSDEGYNNFIWTLDDEKCYPIYAYQTTRTKAAKFEWVMCDECGGCGNKLEYDGEMVGLYLVNLMCKECNRTCRMVRRIK